MTCNPCGGTGFKNIEQIPEVEFNAMRDFPSDVQKWMASQADPHDVQICDCCGDGEGWYGMPGEHYTSEDPVGKNGPYASNGGLCKCH